MVFALRIGEFFEFRNSNFRIRLRFEPRTQETFVSHADDAVVWEFVLCIAFVAGQFQRQRSKS